MSEKEVVDKENGSEGTEAFSAGRNGDKSPSARGEASAFMSPLMKAGITISFIAAVVGLSVGLASLRGDSKGSYTGRSFILSRLSYFDDSVLGGYDQCQDLEDDLKEAVELMTNITIDSLAYYHFSFDYFDQFIQRGGGIGGFAPQPEVMVNDGAPETTFADDTGTGTVADAPEAPKESSFGTNNQVDGVDEADLVKSDGTFVFAAYGDKLIVWDAKSGMELSRTQIPTQDENGIQLCQDIKGSDSETECYSNSNYYGWWGGSGSDSIRIASLMLHQERLTIVASTSLTLQNDYPILKNNRNTRVFIYDVSSIPTDLSPLNLLARKDLQGSYQTARSIGQYAHIVTTSTLNTEHHLNAHLYPWSDRYADMDEETYRAEAFLVAQEKGLQFAANLTSELNALFADDENGECSNIAKVAIMLKNKIGTAGDASSDVIVLPSFTASSVLQTLTQVYSLDLAQDFNASDNVPVAITTSSSGVFFPTASYTTNVYASAEKLIIAGESYVQDDEGEWNEHTILLVYDLQNDTSVPESVGDVPGSLLNQFSMDHYYDAVTNEDYLRVATTTWGRWGIVDDFWQQTEVSESQVSVLRMPSAGDDGGGLEMVGSVAGIGLGERIYAARFFGERAYVVTCKYMYYVLCIIT